MTAYKRNQVEEAISRVLDPRASEPEALLRTRLKRLFDTDRALGRDPREKELEKRTYAFYSDDPPGRGVEIWFSEYEAFAALNGILLMNHGWPQGFAVRVLRRVRAELRREHAWILRKDPKELFDQEAIRKKAQVGDLAFDVTNPILLAIASSGTVVNDEQQFNCKVFRGSQDVFVWGRQQGIARGALTFFEVGGLAHHLHGCLSGTEPKQRGPGQ